MSDSRSLTQEEAQRRAALLTVSSYDIAVDLTDLLEGDALRATSTVRFACTDIGTDTSTEAGTAAETFIDCSAEVVSATLNGRVIDASGIAEGRIRLTHLAPDNELVVESVQRQTGQRAAVQRTVDSDGEVYVWTSFEPDEARRCWACFDQPDLKAPHTFVVDAPARWTVLSNTGDATVDDVSDSVRRWSFAATPPLSTYVPVVNAGPFYERRAQRGDHDLGLYCRRSLADCLDRDAEELFEVTAQGLAFFGEQFALPFPQRRYDQVFVPDMGGAMENYGCVTWSDTFVFRTPPTPADREFRAIILLHEMAHMWFGDMVTMRWWDDLWLNEAFANWACYWAASEATQFSDAWAGFLATSKRGVYAVDRGPTSHPIRQPATDVAEATASFDAITYVKGSSVLKQLAAYVGQDTFVAGLRDYFATHAWGNATLADLMGAVGAAAGRDLSGWTSRWLDEAGHDTVSLGAGPDSSVTIRTAGPDGGSPRPHLLRLGVYERADGALRQADLVEVDIDAAEQVLKIGVDHPDLLLLNDDDLTFAAVRPDADALAALVASAGDLPTSIGRGVALATVWDVLLAGGLQAADFVGCARAVLARETSGTVSEPFLGLAVQAAERWAPDAQRDRLCTELADTCLLLAEGGDTHRTATLRALARTATTDEQLAKLRDLAGDDIDLGWRRLERLAELDRLDAPEVEALRDRDPDPDVWVRVLTVDAARPDPEAKEAAWTATVADRRVPGGALFDVGTAFWRPGQDGLLAPFADRFLEALQDLGASGLLGAMGVSRAMFPVTGVGTDFVDRAVALAHGGTLAPMIEQRLLERADQLSRMLAARG